MSLDRPSIAAERPLEDLLAYLPCSTILNIEAERTIYRPGEPVAGIYLIVEGKVKAGLMADNGRELVIDVYGTDDVFGESAFIEGERSSQAVTLESTRLMMWTLEQIHDLGTRNPKLYLAFVQLIAKRIEQLRARIVSSASDNVGRRLARALIYFSAKPGTTTDGDGIQMAPLTHEFLGQYIGTSGEVVTQNMNPLRVQGYLSYSRKGILLHRQRLEEWLKGAAATPAPSDRSTEPRKTFAARS